MSFIGRSQADISPPAQSEAERQAPRTTATDQSAETPVIVESVEDPATKRNAEPRPASIKKVVIDEQGISILDLREISSSRFRIVGSSFWVTDAGRYKHGGSDYLLVREPKNKWDENAVAVYGKGRKVGHLSEAKAAALAPILDQLTYDAYRVGGAPPARDSIRMWVDIPTVPKLRAFAKTLTERRD